MAKRRKKRTLRPRVPSRVKRRKRPAKERSHHHPELIGLGLVAAGLFLSTLVYLGWEGGTAGRLDRGRPVGARRRRRLPRPCGPRDRRLVDARPEPPRSGAPVPLGPRLDGARSLPPARRFGRVRRDGARRGGRNTDWTHRDAHRRHRVHARRDPAPVWCISRRARPALPRRGPPRPHRRQAPRRAALDARRPAARTHDPAQAQRRPSAGGRGLGLPRRRWPVGAPAAPPLDGRADRDQ